MLRFEKIKTVLFDAGNTIVYPDYDLIEDMLKEFGIGIQADALYKRDCLLRDEWNVLSASPRAAVLSWDDYWQELFRRVGVKAEVMDRMMAKLTRSNEEEKLWAQVFAETHAVLAELHAAGFTLGVISNSDGKVERYLRKAGLRDCFNFVVDSFLVGAAKPDPRIFQISLQLAGTTPAETVFVGDIYTVDVVGARRVGIHPVLLKEALLFRPTVNSPVIDNHFDCVVIQSLAKLIPMLIKPPVLQESD